MIVNVEDFDSLIRGYILDVLKSYYPDMDTSENSGYDDLFIKPMIELLRPFINKISRNELKSNLSNAKYLTDSEMDLLGEGNYFMTREKGSAATTTETLTFANVNLEDENFFIKIPAGATFVTTAGKEFQTKSAIVLDAEAMRNGYNKSKLVYEIDIQVTAVDIGSSYNVGAGEILVCKTFFSNSLVSCVNKVAVTNGKDQEGNEEYAARIREFYISRQLGTEPGYKNFIKELFSEITDVYVAGYKNQYMTRDLLKVYDEKTSKVTERHIGGCVDLYLKGCIYDSNEVSIALHNNIILLECEYDKLSNQADPKKSIQIYNLTDSSKIVAIKSVSAVTGSEFFGQNTGKVKVVIDNSDGRSYEENIVNDMKIVFSYTEKGQVIDGEKYFNVGLTADTLASPVISIDSLMDVNNNILSNMNNRIELIKEGIEGTTDETCTIKLKNCDEFFNGMPIKVTYTSNKTLRQLRDTLGIDDNRIVVADVIGRVAESVPVNVVFSFKVKQAYRNMDKKLLEARVKDSVNSFFKNYKLGDEVQESDLVGWLYTDKAVNDVIDYVALPFEAFYIPKDINEQIPNDGSQLAENGVLNIEEIQYPILNSSRFACNMILS